MISINVCLVDNALHLCGSSPPARLGHCPPRHQAGEPAVLGLQARRAPEADGLRVRQGDAQRRRYAANPVLHTILCRT